MFTKVNGQTMLSPDAYSFFKRLVQIWIPAISSLYFGLSGIWDLPATTQVVGTLALLATFLGVSITVSSKHYDASGAAYDGHIVVIENAGSKLISLELDGDPEEIISTKDSVTFKIPGPSPIPPQIEDFSHEDDV